MAEHYFDVNTGSYLLGHDAINQHLEQTGPEAVPVPVVELLTQPDFPYQHGDFTPAPIEWDRQNCIMAGRWLLKMLEQSGQEPNIQRQHLRRLAILGLGPPVFRATASNGFTNLKGFNQAVEAVVKDFKGDFDNWDLHDLAHYAHQLKGGKKVSGEDVDAAAAKGDGPGRVKLRQLIGGIAKLNELLGYYDIRSWKSDDYLLWGAKVEIANDSEIVQPHQAVLAKKGHGPSLTGIRNHFDCWANFKLQVPDVKKQLLAREVEARRLLIDHCSPNTKPEAKEALATRLRASLILGIKKFNSSLSAGDIEMSAIMLDLYDIIWPPDRYRENLRVPAKELAKFRAEAAALRRRYPHTK